MVEVPERVLSAYRYWSLYNSPYAAHDRGCAIDLYPDPGTAPSPVAGRVVETRTVQAPPKPYAPEHDHLIVIDTAAAPPAAPRYRTATGAATLARILHVDPAVEPGDRVRFGDHLGTMVRAGFFAPWVENHIHLGVRAPDDDPVRAAGSLPLDPGVTVQGQSWDGTGTVVEAGETYALLDSPGAPTGDAFVGIEADGGGVLDGGLSHYDSGGLLGVEHRSTSATDGEEMSLLGTTIGHRDGRTVDWTDPTVLVDGEPITGLSLFVAHTDGFGAKLICRERSLSVGERVRVELE